MQFKDPVAGDLQYPQHLNWFGVEITAGDRQQFAFCENETGGQQCIVGFGLDSRRS